MISGIISFLSGAMKAVNAWFRKEERDTHIEAGMDKQKVVEHDQNEQARAEKRARDERVRNDPALGERLRDAFRDTDSG